MTGQMVVVRDLRDVESLLASQARPTFVKEWAMADLEKDVADLKGRSVMRGMKAFMIARCNQCHAVKGHGATIGPDLTEVAKKYKGTKLLKQVLDPSSELNEKFQGYQIYKTDGTIVSGTFLKEDEKTIHLIPNLLAPKVVTVVAKNEIEQRMASKVSAMPLGMVNMLTKEEILDLLAFLEAGGFEVPPHLKKGQH